jgi:hypothetical protein
MSLIDGLLPRLKMILVRWLDATLGQLAKIRVAAEMHVEPDQVRPNYATGVTSA